MPFPSLDEFISSYDQTFDQSKTASRPSKLPVSSSTPLPDQPNQPIEKTQPSPSPSSTPLPDSSEPTLSDSSSEEAADKYPLAELGRRMREKAINKGLDVKKVFGDFDDEEIAVGLIQKYPEFGDVIDFKSSNLLKRIATEFNPEESGVSPDGRKLTPYRKRLAIANTKTTGNFSKDLPASKRLYGQIPIDVPRLYKAVSKGMGADDFVAQHDEAVGITPENRMELDKLGVKSFPNLTKEQLDQQIKLLANNAYLSGHKQIMNDITAGHYMTGRAFRLGGLPMARAVVEQLTEEDLQKSGGIHPITPEEVADINSMRRSVAADTGTKETIVGLDQTVKNVLNVVGGFDPADPGKARLGEGAHVLPWAGEAARDLQEAAPEVQQFKQSEGYGETLIHAGPGIIAGTAEMLGAGGVGAKVGGKVLESAGTLGPIVGGLLGLQADTAIQNLDKPLTEQAKHQLMTAAMSGSALLAPIAQGVLAKYGIDMSNKAVLVAASGLSAATGGGMRYWVDPNATKQQMTIDALVGGLLPLGFAAMHAGQQRLGQSKPRLMDQVTEVEQPRQIAGLLPEPKFNIRSEEPQVVDQQIKPAKAGGIEVVDIYGDPKVKYEVANEQEARFHLDNLKTFASSEEFKQLPKEKQAVVRDEVARLGRELLMEPEVIGMTPEELLASQRKLSGVPVTGEGDIKPTGVRVFTEDGWQGGDKDWTDVALQQIDEKKTRLLESNDRMEELGRLRAETTGPEMESKSDFDRYFGEWLTSKTSGEPIRPRAAVKIPASTPEMPVMYVNDTAAKLFQKAWADVYPTTKLTPSNPVALSTKSLPKVIGQLFDEASRHPAGSVERTELEGLAGILGYLWSSRPAKGGSFQVLPVLSGESIKKILVTRRHELVHQEQMQLAANTGQTAKDVYKLTDPGFLATHPLSEKILSEGGYLLDHYAPEAWTAEAVAYAASGEGFRIGLTPGESAQLVSDYRTHLQAKYGEVGGQIFKRAHPEVARLISNESIKEARKGPCGF